MAAKKILRCACYTRKSSDDGLEQEFNSLDAQREACEAYVKSQASEGWKALPAHYDDGGYSGGSMERPGLKQLLADIAAGKVDVVVVYKIDRLTRSLPDFARMVELFDKHEVSFVSVTQSFNTTSSMGRLTLNVLLSFAQFEREVTGERIRDKIAASKAKGMWMGGVPPLGYDLPTDLTRTLVVNPQEAATIQLIFEKYLEFGSVYLLQTWLKNQGYVSKKRITANGRTMGGVTMLNGHLYHLLRNQVYTGKITHKGAVHPGNHKPILSQKLFDQVQQSLDAGSRRRKDRETALASAPFTGRIFDSSGEVMSPANSWGRKGKRYRYYVSSSLQKGARPKTAVNGEERALQRVPAQVLEDSIAALIERLIPGHSGSPLDLPRRIEVHRSAVHLILPKTAAKTVQSRLTPEETLEPDHADPSCVRLIASVSIRNRRGRTEISSAALPRPKRDPFLVNALRRAHQMVTLDDKRLPILKASPETQYARRLIRMAFLAPDLQQAILAGTQPADLNLEHLLAEPIPVEWVKQRELFAQLSF